MNRVAHRIISVMLTAALAVSITPTSAFADVQLRLPRIGGKEAEGALSSPVKLSTSADYDEFVLDVLENRSHKGKTAEMKEDAAYRYAALQSEFRKLSRPRSDKPVPATVTIEKTRGNNDFSDLTWSAKTLGLDEKKGETLFEADSDQLTAAAQNALNAKINAEVDRQAAALAQNLPNDFYWVDASKGIEVSYKLEKSGAQKPVIGIKEITLSFTPAKDYSAGDQLNTEKGNRVVQAKSKIDKLIVKAPSGVAAEKAAVTQYYNQIAKQTGGSGSEAVGPALLKAFDGDAATKLSASESSLVFQWMFDRSKMPGAKCYTVQGQRNKVAHTWNVVTLSDGQTYVVDIDNGKGPLLALAKNENRALMHSAGNKSYSVQYGKGDAAQTFQYSYDSQQDLVNNKTAPMVTKAPPMIDRIEIRNAADNGKTFVTEVPTVKPFEPGSNSMNLRAWAIYDSGEEKDVTDLCVWTMDGKAMADTTPIEEGVVFDAKTQTLQITNEASTPKNNNNKPIKVKIKATPSQELMKQAAPDKTPEGMAFVQEITVNHQLPEPTHIAFPQRVEKGGGGPTLAKDVFERDEIVGPPDGPPKEIEYDGMIYDQYGHKWDTAKDSWVWTWEDPKPVSDQLTMKTHAIVKSRSIATIKGGADAVIYTVKVQAKGTTKTIDHTLTIEIKKRLEVDVELSPKSYTTTYNPKINVDVFKAIVPSLPAQDVEKYAQIQYAVNNNGIWSTNPPTQVGTHGVRAVFSSPEYYGVSEIGTLIIKPVDLSEEGMVDIIVQGGVVYNGRPQRPKITVRHAVTGILEEGVDYTIQWSDNTTDAYESGNPLFSDSESPYVEIIGTGKNYNGRCRKEFDIKRLPIKADRFGSDPIDKIYDGTPDIEKKLMMTVNGVGNDGKMMFEIGAHYVNKDAGKNIQIELDEIDAAILASVPRLRNYLVTLPNNLRGEIKPRPITVTPTSRNDDPKANKKKYGQVDPVLKYEVGGQGLVGEEQLSGQMEREPGEDVLGKDKKIKYRPIRQGSLTSDQNPNYEITFKAGTTDDRKFLIEPATINVGVQFDPSTTKINRRVLVIVTAQNGETELLPSGWNEPERPTVKVLKDATGTLGDTLTLTGGARGVYQGEFHTPPRVPEDPIMRFEVSMDDRTGNYVNPTSTTIVETEIVEKGKVNLTLDHNKPDGSYYGDTIIFTVKAIKEDPMDPDDVNGNVEFYLGDPGNPMDPDNPGVPNEDFPNKTYVDGNGIEQKVIKLGGSYLSKGECTFKLLEPRDLIVENGLGGWHDIYAVYRGNSAFWPAEAVQKPVQILKKQLEWDTSDLTASKRENQKGDTDVYGQLRLKGVMEDEVTVRPGPLRTNGFDEDKPGVYENVQVVPKEGGIWELVSNPEGIENNYLRPIKNPTISATVEKVTEPEQTELPKPTEPGQKYKLTVQHGLSKVPDSLLNNPLLDTTTKIQRAMLEFNMSQMEGVSAERSVMYDVTLMISRDNGIHWEPVTAENFPKEGLPITLPYPEGTSKKNDFVVSHMFTTDDFGKVPGNIENCAIQHKKDGLRFVVHGLSPIMISWKAPDGENPTPTPSPSATPNPAKPTATPGNGNNTKPTATTSPKPGSTTSPTPGKGNGNGNGSKPSSGAGYQTGDETHMGIWLTALVFCGVMALILYKKRRK